MLLPSYTTIYLLLLLYMYVHKVYFALKYRNSFPVLKYRNTTIFHRTSIIFVVVYLYGIRHDCSNNIAIFFLN